MYRIDTPDAVVVAPAPAGMGTEGFWTHGNPGTGQAATTLDQDFFNMTQEALLAFLTVAGVGHSKSDYGRLWQAWLRAQCFFDAGSANHIIANPAVAFTAGSLGFGTTVRVTVANTNSGAVDFNFGGSGALPVAYVNGAAIGAGDFPAGVTVELVHDGAGHWHCLTITPSALARMVTAGYPLPWSVANGGTGLGSLTQYGIVMGQGAGAVLVLPPGAAGTRLTSVGASNFPVFVENVKQLLFVSAASSGTLTVPANVFRIWCRCVAGGGGGAMYNGTNSGGGGGAGGCAWGLFAVTPGDAINWTCGIGGNNNNAGGDGGIGGSSTIAALVSATPGAPGISVANAGGGLGGFGTVGGSVIAGTGGAIYGGMGEDGTAGGPTARAGSGGASRWGGGSRGTATNPFPPNAAPGAGGGGSYGVAAASSAPGLAGSIEIWG